MGLNLACSTLRTALRTIFLTTFRTTFRTSYRTSSRKFSVPSSGVLPQIILGEDRIEVGTYGVRVMCSAGRPEIA
jgi:hypothetical protein